MNSMPDPATRSFTVLETRISSGFACAATRAPVCTAIPATFGLQSRTRPYAEIGEPRSGVPLRRPPPGAFARRLPSIGVGRCFSEADSGKWMSSAAASNIPRGRKPVFSDEALRSAARYSYARRVRSRRGAQDLVYRQFAIAAIELYCEAYPEKADRLEWLLVPEPRHSLLTELGRIAKPRSGEQEALEWNAQNVSMLIRA